MDEKKLRLLEEIQNELSNVEEKQVKPKFLHPNQSNPIYKKLAKFCNEKIGDKLSVKDLLRG